jgi:hypothetical protein
MSVYVDDMRAPFGRLIMCHMIADTEVELHAMADRIGVARRWHQGDHYDISLTKRAKAVALGAQEITWRDCGLMMVARRHDLHAPLLTPDQGRAWLAERMAKRKPAGEPT